MPSKKPVRRLPPGTPVVSPAGVRGVVLRHVPGADGGSYRVRWENGYEGRMSPANLTQEPR